MNVTVSYNVRDGPEKWGNCKKKKKKKNVPHEVFRVIINSLRFTSKSRRVAITDILVRVHTDLSVRSRFIISTASERNFLSRKLDPDINHENVNQVSRYGESLCQTKLLNNNYNAITHPNSCLDVPFHCALTLCWFTDSRLETWLFTCAVHEAEQLNCVHIESAGRRYI